MGESGATLLGAWAGLGDGGVATGQGSIGSSVAAQGAVVRTRRQGGIMELREEQIDGAGPRGGQAAATTTLGDGSSPRLPAATVARTAEVQNNGGSQRRARHMGQRRR